uniref:Uncharacterized protein n=1 Tax=Leersia perrieri TaxID=77586 RepID=A0A0D9XJT7_9ORYZ
MAVTPPLPPHDRCKGSIERAGHARSAPRGAEGRLGLKSVGGGRRRSRAAGIRGVAKEFIVTHYRAQVL